jgi:hypothetical protein
MKTSNVLLLLALAAVGYYVYTQMNAQAAASVPVSLQTLLGSPVATVTLAAIGNPAVGQQFTYNGAVYTLAQSAAGYYGIGTT